MREFKKRRTWGAELLRVSGGLAGVLALGAVAFFASRAAGDMYGKFAEASAARSGAEAELQDLRERHQKIEADVAALSSERGVEAAARERYGVVKPGEGQITIVRQSTSTEVLRQESGLLQKIWRSLFVW